MCRTLNVFSLEYFFRVFIICNIYSKTKVNEQLLKSLLALFFFQPITCIETTYHNVVISFPLVKHRFQSLDTEKLLTATATF